MAKSAQTTPLTDTAAPGPKSTRARHATSGTEHQTTASGSAGATADTTEDASVVEAAREAAVGHAEETKQKAAQAAEEQAEHFRDAGESFDPNSYARVATDRVAEGLSGAAQSLQNTDLSALGDDVATFARRQPLLFFGGAALLGFAAARMLKASERAEYDETSFSRYS